ncbi:hypothetical protein P4E94_19290 [Pontiellaceae bacterium B12219]|nr:hypothetical protein [Pontiellaceae bacterium B12219]
MKSITRTILAALLCTASAFACFGPIPDDHILFEGKLYPINHYPLDEYFYKHHPEKLPDTESTADERGYIASFCITNDTLAFLDIKPETYTHMYKKKPNESIKQDIFPDTPLVTIDWFSGVLVLPYGETTKDDETIYTHFILVEIKKGKVNEIRRLTAIEYDQVKDIHFSIYKRTDEYKLNFGSEEDDEVRAYYDAILRNSIFDNYIHCFSDKTNSPNQKLQPTVKTPVKSGNVQGTAAEL